jgi:hypothetical protein
MILIYVSKSYGTKNCFSFIRPTTGGVTPAPASAS